MKEMLLRGIVRPLVERLGTIFAETGNFSGVRRRAREAAWV